MVFSYNFKVKVSIRMARKKRTRGTISPKGKEDEAGKIIVHIVELPTTVRLYV